MIGSLCGALAGCACSMFFGVSVAMATDGRIVFSGAIVEPTCGFTPEIAAAFISEVPGRKVRVACAGAGGVTINAPQAYALQVVPINNITGNPLLDYFSSYATGNAGETAAKLVTRTYE